MIRGQSEINRFMTQRVAHLVAILGINRNRPLHREKLVELLWPDVDPAVSRLRLNQAISSLRRQFKAIFMEDELLLSDRWTVQLNASLVQTDIAEFESLCRTATDSIPALNHAVSIYRGELLPGVHEDWVLGERARLGNLYISSLDRLWRLVRDEGDIDEAMNIALRLVDADGFREESHLAVISLYGLQGRVAPALSQFKVLETSLLEIGAAPSLDALRVIERIKTGGVAVQPPKARSSETHTTVYVARPHTINTNSSLFGRQAEIDLILECFHSGEERLITLTGMAGIGKSALSLEVGRRLRKLYREVHFVALANLGSPGQIITAALDAMGESFSDAEGNWKALSATLNRKGDIVLIIDNFEHLINAASFIAGLLADTPNLKLLVTSRVPLSLCEEKVIEVTPLSVPHVVVSLEEMTTYPGVQMFLDRARRARADFAITPRNMATIQKVCQKLEGLPLALELAAGWALTMAPSQMLQGLESRFDFLHSRRRDIVERHRSLYRAIDYGFSLLEPDLRELFVSISIFSGGFSEEAATAVTQFQSVRDGLITLAERSMIQAVPSDSGIRFTVLESLQEFGSTYLSAEQGSVLRERHARFFGDLAEKAKKEHNGSSQAAWLSTLALDHQNLSSALEWTERNNTSLGLEMACDLDWYWEAKGYLRKGRQWIEKLLQATISPSLEGKALNSLGWISWNQGDLGKAEEVSTRARRIFEDISDNEGVQTANYNLGVIKCRQGNLLEAEQHLKESLHTAEERSDFAGKSKALLVLGVVVIMQGSIEQAKDFFLKSLNIEQDLGNVMRTSFAMSNLGNIAIELNEYDLAVQYFERCVKLAHSTGHLSYEGIFSANLGLALAELDRFPESKRAFARGLKISVGGGHDHMAFRCIWKCAVLATRANIQGIGTFWGIAANLSSRLPTVETEVCEFNRDECDRVSDAIRNSSRYINERALAMVMEPSEAIRFVFSWLGSESGEFH